ncbi:endonuclease domain-containing 1 protein-like [Misgurnus anguillicaudatus]|uniref:endonuclease domain-containing 1 protein-like n=1 Tax=Misgurnus anguillicaudatus TaxID=75329 RepID=UPI003CCF5AB0
MNVSVLLLLICPSVISKVIDFSECSQFFNQEKPPVIPGILENSHSMDNRYKTICQKYENEYRFATLYDTTNRIPVFSAYRFTEKQSKCKRPHIKWRIEPELELLTSDKMKVKISYENQATDEDYTNNNYNVNRGHLFPSCHSGDEVTARSTFTLTNAVPQKISFNSGSWNRLEMKTKDLMDNYCRDKNDQNKVLAHVLTGAVPSKDKNQLNNRVNIPSYMWMTFCCYNSTSSSWVSQAYWAPNEDENKIITISKISLGKLQEFLSEEWVKITKLFDNNNCK